MSTPTPAVPAEPTPASERQEISIVSHSNLFYWWPIWALGFIFALLTAVENHVMAVLPAHTLMHHDVVVAIDGKSLVGKRDAAVSPPRRESKNEPAPTTEDLNRLHVSRNKAYGVTFVIVLLLVIFITNVPLRGMWSVLIIMAVVMLIIIFALADLWEPLVQKFSLLDIRINMGGYLTLATVLFILWLVTFLFFDRQIYIVFSPRQFRVCTEIGGGEKVYETTGMSVERQRSDLFRHWILGLGSGDLIVKTSGSRNEHFDLHNVLFINRKVRMIEELMQRQLVTETKG